MTTLFEAYSVIWVMRNVLKRPCSSRSFCYRRSTPWRFNRPPFLCSSGLIATSAILYSTLLAMGFRLITSHFSRSTLSDMPGLRGCSRSSCDSYLADPFLADSKDCLLLASLVVARPSYHFVTELSALQKVPLSFVPLGGCTPYS